MSNRCLVYINNTLPFAPVIGYTHIAQIIRSYVQGNVLWYDLKLLTDDNGQTIDSETVVTVSGDRIVSNRAYKDNHLRAFYYYGDSVMARSLVIKDNLQNPLSATTRSGLGSGIYGTTKLNTITPDFIIECNHPFPVQDKEHGASLSLASINTNVYIDELLVAIRNQPDPSTEQVLKLIAENPRSNILTLWNIVLSRVLREISETELNTLIANYLIRYLFEDDFLDTNTHQPIQELPINHILGYLGYDGVISLDAYDNGWDRGCVSYNIEQATVKIGEYARY